jgi:hypothetical protein
MSVSEIPFDEATELAVIGTLLAEPERAAERMPSLRPNFFNDLRFREVFNVIRGIVEDGAVPDVVTVGRQPGMLAPDFLSIISDSPDKSCPPAFPQYVEVLAELAARRQLLEMADRAQKLAMNRTVPLNGALEDFGNLAATLAPKPISHSLPSIVDAAEFAATPHEHPRELIQGLLHQGSKLVLGGGSKSFKTWTLLDLALSVAHGLPWLGRETTSGDVLYANFEIQDYPWQKRIQAVAHAKGIELTPGKIKLWNLRGKAADFRTLIPRIIQATKESGFALIILDPIYKLYGRTDENKAGDVAALLNGMEELAVETKAAVAFGAHFSKGNQSSREAIDRISGSGVFARDPDSILIFTKHEEEDAYTVDSILRNFKPIEPFAVRWSFPLFRLADELDPSKLKQPAGRKPDYLPDDLFKLLPGQGLTNKDWRAAAEDQGIKERTFFRLKKTLETTGRILDSKVTGRWMPINSNGASH